MYLYEQYKIKKNRERKRIQNVISNIMVRAKLVSLKWRRLDSIELHRVEQTRDWDRLCVYVVRQLIGSCPINTLPRTWCPFTRVWHNTNTQAHNPGHWSHFPARSNRIDPVDAMGNKRTKSLSAFTSINLLCFRRQQRQTKGDRLQTFFSSPLFIHSLNRV